MGSGDRRESTLLKRDFRFQLQRTRTSNGFVLVKRSARDGLRHERDVLLEREFRLFQTLGAPASLTPLRLERRSEGLAAYFEDFDALPLSFSGRPTAPDLSVFLSVAGELCSIVTALHARGLVVLGTAPGSFLRGQSGIRLSDAPFAQRAATLRATETDAWLDSPYLPYLAPEVLNGNDSGVDYRADLYSLGAILYELLSGQPPFVANDPAELIQSHLAKEPTPLTSLEPAVPPSVCRAIMKLLAKQPRDRYADVSSFSRALLRTAERVDALAASHEAPHPPPVLSFAKASHKLYGREPSIRRLSEEMRQVPRSPRVIFVEGDSGVGKTSLLEAVRRGRSGHHCQGAFLQTGPVVPLSGWTSALSELANGLLASSVMDLERWRREIRAALGDSAALIGAMVPEWNAILRGKSRESAEMDPSHNSLAVAIHRLFACFAERAPPVVLFLEDLQFADASSLRILEVVLTLPEPLSLLLVATVRSSAHAPHEPAALAGFRGALSAAGVDTETLRLNAWGKAELCEFLTDLFEGRLDGAEGLADLVLQKTHGNPFWARQWLAALAERGGFVFAPDRARWHCQEHAVRSVPAADNVVDFLSKRIAGLAPDSIGLLKTAACLGRRFRLADLAAATDRSETALLASFQSLLNEGLVLETRDEAALESAGGAGVQPGEIRYSFVHDRVLEASRTLMSDSEQAALSLELGRRLLRTAGARDMRATELAGHFNRGALLVTDPEERLRAAELDLVAGRDARQRGAFSQTLELFQFGIRFLTAPNAPTESFEVGAAWRDHFDLTRNLFEGAAEAALLNGDIERVYRLCDEALAHVKSPLERAPIYGIRVAGLNAQKRFSAAVDAALEILRELGVRFPQHPTQLHAVAGYLTTRRRVLARAVSDLATLPEMTDARIKAAGKIIQAIFSAAYLGRPKLFPLLVYRHVNDSIAFGNEDYSAATYSAFAIVLCAMGDFDNGMRLGEVALGLLRRFEAERLKAPVLMSHGMFVMAWKRHVSEVLSVCDEGIAAGLKHGDFEYACYLVTVKALARLQAGVPLDELAAEFVAQRAKLRSLGQQRSILLQELLLQTVLDLRGEGGPEPLTGPAYREVTSLPQCLKPLDENLAFHHFNNKLMLSVLLRDRRSAIEAARAGRRYLAGGAFGNYLGGVFRFYESLAILSGRSTTSLRLGERRRVAQNQHKTKKWALSAPMNFGHKYELVEAERCRRAARNDLAAEHYERAIELSLEHGFTHEAALAQERAAAFYFERGLMRLGRVHLRDAYASYSRWGAAAVTRRLDASFGQELALLDAESDSPRPSSRPGGVQGLDYRMLLKSSQAISSEVQLPQLVERLLETILANAAAQRGILLLDRRGTLTVEAEADVDSGTVEHVSSETLESTQRLCRSVAYYVARTERPLILVDASNEGIFTNDAYVRERAPRSILCSPILYQGRLLGLAYLENNRMSHVFTDSRLEIVNLLAGQAAISIANARFHELQLEAQQAKIKPHFLFNALSSIADLALLDGNRAEAAILQLANLYRYVLTTSVEELVLLEQELEIVRSYLALEQLRFGDKLEFSVAVDGDISRVRVPGLLIQPLVENSVRHAIAHRLTPGRIWVRAAADRDKCSIVVQDDGEGLKTSSSGTGFGLKSVTERLSLAYGDAYSLAISSAAGYRVEIEIPLVSNATRRRNFVHRDS